MYQKGGTHPGSFRKAHFKRYFSGSKKLSKRVLWSVPEVKKSVSAGGISVWFSVYEKKTSCTEKRSGKRPVFSVCIVYISIWITATYTFFRLISSVSVFYDKDGRRSGPVPAGRRAKMWNAQYKDKMYKCIFIFQFVYIIIWLVRFFVCIIQNCCGLWSERLRGE